MGEPMAARLRGERRGAAARWLLAGLGFLFLVSLVPSAPRGLSPAADDGPAVSARASLASRSAACDRERSQSPDLTPLVLFFEGNLSSPPPRDPAGPRPNDGGSCRPGYRRPLDKPPVRLA